MAWNEITSAITGLLGLLNLGAIWRVQWLHHLYLAFQSRTCDSLFWKDIGPGHLNSAPANVPLVSTPTHELSRCWEPIIRNVFSSGFGTTAVPSSLEMSTNSLLCVDTKVLLAFVLSVVPAINTDAINYAHPPGRVFDGSIVSLAVEGGQLTAHVNGHRRRLLTKEDCEGLIEGYPPWYRQSIALNGPARGNFLRHPCYREPDNLRRAGWVIAVALTDIAPVPIYFNRCDFVDGAGRAKVLRAGCSRAIEVLKRRFSDFEIDGVIEHAQSSLELTTDSFGTHYPFPTIFDGMDEGNWVKVAETAISIFDTQPGSRLCDEASRSIEEFGTLMIYWASTGMHKIMAYCKSVGREAELDSRLESNGRVYLTECHIRQI